jgi:hypothetical protein
MCSALNLSPRIEPSGGSWLGNDGNVEGNETRHGSIRGPGPRGILLGIGGGACLATLRRAILRAVVDDDVFPSIETLPLNRLDCLTAAVVDPWWA